MGRVDPNKYVDGVPLTPRQIIERAATLDDASEGYERRRDALKKDVKELGDSVKANDERRRDLFRCHRMGRCVYLLTDGTITTEPPRGLELWDAATRGHDAEKSEAAAASYVAPIFELFGVGKPKGISYRRKLEDGKAVLVQTESAGEWLAARAKAGADFEPIEGGPWRSCSDAMLAALASVEWKGDAKGEVAGWKASAEIAGSIAVKAPAADAPAKAGKSSKAKASTDDGAIFRASYGEGRSIAVAQVTSPGPWSAYADAKRIGGDFETADAAKEAVRDHLKAKDLTWLSSKGTIAPPSTPQPNVGKETVQAPPGVTLAMADAAAGRPTRRTRAAK